MPGTIVGGFVHTNTNGGPSPINLNAQTTTFYWVTAANSQVVTVTVNFDDGTSASATATFNVVGPTAVSVATPLGQWQVNPNSSGFELDFGFPISPDLGIQFNGRATSPSGYTGTYEWVQLIGGDNTTFTAGSSTLTCTKGTGLDNQFPYSTGLSTSDSPSLGLPSADSKVTRSNTFKMYFMWRPGLTGDIPVPLGYVSWQIFGDAVQSGGTWTAQSDSTRSANAFQASSSYPQWTSTVTNSGPPTCQ